MEKERKRAAADPKGIIKIPNSSAPAGVANEGTRPSKPELRQEIDELAEPKSQQSPESLREALHQDIIKFNENTMKKLKITKTNPVYDY